MLGQDPDRSLIANKGILFQWFGKTLGSPEGMQGRETDPLPAWLSLTTSMKAIKKNKWRLGPKPVYFALFQWLFH